MATATKFQDFVEQLGLGKHNLNGDALMLLLTNVAPVNTNTIRGNLTEIASGNGYTTGGIDTANAYTESGGTGTLVGDQCVWTGGPSDMATFQYQTLYNDTQTSPVDPLVLFWNYGSGVTLHNGETFTAKFSNQASAGTILTLA